MRVFILSTGRCGSTSFAKACSHISNYTSAHESLSNRFGPERFNYPDQHIEIDNRLSWHLGQLDSNFGDNAIYILLKRDREKVALSYLDRFLIKGSIMDAFCEGIRMTPPTQLNKQEKLQSCYDYIDTVNSNIRSFLSNKTRCMTINIEHIHEEFPDFWNYINADGNLEDALNEFDLRHNVRSKRNWNLPYRLNAYLKREIQHFKMTFSKS